MASFAYTLRRLGRAHETVGLTDRGRQYLPAFTSRAEAQRFARFMPAFGPLRMRLETVPDRGTERDVTAEIDLMLAARGMMRAAAPPLLSEGRIVIRTGVLLCAPRPRVVDRAEDMYSVHLLDMTDVMLLPLEKGIGILLPTEGVPSEEEELEEERKQEKEQEQEQEQEQDIRLECTVVQAWLTDSVLGDVKPPLQRK